MKREEIKILFDKLIKETDKLKAKEKMAREEAQLIARKAASSPSTSGDRYHAESQAQIIQDFLERSEKLVEQIKDSLSDKPKRICAPCFVKVVDSAGKEDSFYFVESAVNLKGTKLVSKESPLGQVLNNKKVGDSYMLLDKEYFLSEIK